MTEDRFFVLSYGMSPAYDIRTVEELDRQLDEAHAESERDEWGYLAMLHIYGQGDDGPLLQLGVGRAFSLLTFDAAWVRGDLDRGEKSWWLWSQPGDWGPGIGIPNEVAREAAWEFVRTGERPTNVEWVEDET